MDLTQGFFVHLLGANALGSVAPEKGRFRSFLLASFNHFIYNQRRAAEAVRRGGGKEVLSLTGVDFDARYDREPVDLETPELLFQRSWVESLLAKVLARLADDYGAAGKSELFVLLEPHLTAREHAVSRAEIGRKLKLSAAAIAMSLHRMRRRYGELLREEVAFTVDDPAEVEDELKSLMSIVARTA
jgi:RNA polymerase sigma-70 factor (ECF subfamily)